MRSAEVLLKCLENEGVEYIFGVPGEENIDMMDALLQSKIKFITTRHETGAAFMAGIMGKLTGKPGVCLSTLGPGATNMLTGVADGNMDRTPIVAITGQAGLNRLHKESHQAYDLIAMYSPVTKWNTRISVPESIPEIVRKAFKIARNEKPGATHIEYPEDIAGMDMEDLPPLSVTELKPSRASLQSLEEAKDLINKAKSPLVLAGNGVIRTHASDELVTFAEKLQAPVTETFMGKGVISWAHPLSLMTVGLTFKDYVSHAMEQSDLILAVGYDMTEIPPQRFNPNGDKPIIHIDTQNAEVDSAYPVICNVVGDIASNLIDLTEMIDKQDKPADYVEQVRTRILEEFQGYENDTAFPVKPQKIVYDLRKIMGESDITLSDTGAHKMWMARMYHCYEPNTCLISNGLASMGIAVPGAIAAKMVHPDKKVVAVVGDGAFLMNGMDLETAVRLKLPIVILIWHDDAYGLIEWKQNMAFQRSSHIKFGDPDFVKLAEAYGAKGIRIEKTEDLQKALIEATESDGPVLIDCPVDYSENMKLSERMKDLKWD